MVLTDLAAFVLPLNASLSSEMTQYVVELRHSMTSAWTGQWWARANLRDALNQAYTLGGAVMTELCLLPSKH